MSSLVDPPAPEATTSGEISLLRTAEDTITLEAHGVLDPDALAAALTEVGSQTTATIVLDLTGVSFFSMEAAWVLLKRVRSSDAVPGPRVVVRPSTAVVRKLISLGLGELVPGGPPQHD